MGQSTTKVDFMLHPRHVNILTVCIFMPVSVITLAFQTVCLHPVCIQLEEQSSTTLFVDDFSEAGLLRQLMTSARHKPKVGKEEVSQVF